MPLARITAGYCVPTLQGSFSISLLVQDNFSPMIGKIKKKHALICSLLDRHQCYLKHARAGKIWAWLVRTQLSTNIFVLTG
jgi:hypothetical protein